MSSEDQMSEAQINECRDKFKMFDSEGRGTITVRELGVVMRQLGVNPTDEELQEMIQEVDESGEGEITFQQFISIMAHKMKDADSEQGTLEAFRVFDKERTGFISRGELKSILMTMGQLMTEEEAEDLLEETQSNPEGNIDYMQFVKSLFQSL
ncbi:hypothetical protein FGO68_gene10885 [Halteria grandinella]|uniref:Calmodulin n=1 Tax=Halteria grandinella TaxID=5974 RepID=A0A8J8SYG1_HALGN|nr:hypothetical protein FGO68_gene10885 [Halteria grandinella]